MNNTALHPLEEGFRWFGPADPVPLSYIRQASAAQFHAKDSVQMHLTPLGASHFIAGGHKKTAWFIRLYSPGTEIKSQAQNPKSEWLKVAG